MKLHALQEDASKSTASYVVLRWGRRTGKDELIDAMATADDLILHPSLHMTEQFRRRDMDNKSKIHRQHYSGSMIVRTRGLKPKRVFINEPALHNDLWEELVFIEKYMQPDQIFLIGSPLISKKLTSGGFLFDAICARLELTPVDGYHYSIGTFKNNPAVPKDFEDEMQENIPAGMYKQEIQARFKGGKL